MEILVLGDSLTFGRPKHGICRDLTWPYLLSKQLGCGLQMRARGGATMIDVVNEAQFLNRYWFEGLKARSFDITFIQAGIVDCCPRLVPRRFYGHARRAPGFRRLERSPRAHRLLARPWTSKSRFAKTLSDLLKILPNISRTIFFIEIARPANYLIDNVGDFSDSVDSYNAIIQALVGPASLVKWQAVESGEIHLLPDGHHLTVLGHQAVAKACLNLYQEVL
jgi:hypothetical protein